MAHVVRTPILDSWECHRSISEAHIPLDSLLDLQRYRQSLDPFFSRIETSFAEAFLSARNSQVKGSDWLGDQDAIHYMCREAPKSVLEVRSLPPLLSSKERKRFWADRPIPSFHFVFSWSTSDFPSPVHRKERSTSELSEDRV